MKVARWAVGGMLLAAVVALAFALGFVVRGVDERDSGGGAPSEQTTGFSVLDQIREILQDRYVSPDRLDDQALYEAAIDGMLGSLSDKGTFYVDAKSFQLTVGPKGSFDGIGATVSEQDGEIIIVQPIPGTPADRAGIQPGDVILEVNGESTKGWNTDEAVLHIRGPRGSDVTLKLRRDGEELEVTITRDRIQVESVTTTPPAGAFKDSAGKDVTDFGYVRILEFTQNTRDELEPVLKAIVESGKTGIVLDMRGNPGGLLNTVIDVADMFLDSGVILYEVGRDGNERAYNARSGGVATDLDVVILVDGTSASGSEVLSAALRDNERATVVGETTFGKGTVNTSEKLSDGGALFVSIAHWLTPKRVLIDNVGIQPDVELALTPEDIDARRDTQLFKAIDLLRGTQQASH